MLRFSRSKNPTDPTQFSVTETPTLLAYREEMLPYFVGSARWHTVEGVEGVPLRAVTIGPRYGESGLLILNGYADSLLYYVELAFRLRETGITIVLYDHRGQGLSGRLLPDNAKGHVESSDRYISDAKRVYESLFKPSHFERRVMLGHSMGGAIASLYVRTYPDDFGGIILTAPMFRIHTRPIPRPVAGLVVQLQDFIGLGTHYTVGQGPYTVPSFDENVITSDRDHYDLIRTIIRDHPEVRIGGATARWAAEAFRLSRRARLANRAVELPMLLLHGEKDPVVRISPRDFPRRSARFAERVLPSALHGLFLERSEVVSSIAEEIAGFFEHGPIHGSRPNGLPAAGRRQDRAGAV